nr:hypothetical protein [Planctomycetota bacterium]
KARMAKQPQGLKIPVKGLKLGDKQGGPRQFGLPDLRRRKGLKIPVKGLKLGDKQGGPRAAIDEASLEVIPAARKAQPKGVVVGNNFEELKRRPNAPKGVVVGNNFEELKRRNRAPKGAVAGQNFEKIKVTKRPFGLPDLRGRKAPGITAKGPR